MSSYVKYKTDLLTGKTIQTFKAAIMELPTIILSIKLHTTIIPKYPFIQLTPHLYD